MATTVHMEALSPTMEEGRLVKWTKKEGDPVKTGETLAEVETDKAVMELIARADGNLVKVLVPEGKTVPVGDVVAYIGAPGEKVGEGMSWRTSGRRERRSARRAPRQLQERERVKGEGSSPLRRQLRHRSQRQPSPMSESKRRRWPSASRGRRVWT